MQTKANDSTIWRIYRRINNDSVWIKVHVLHLTEANYTVIYQNN